MPNVPAYRHYIDMNISDPNNALVEVGPRLCDNPALQGAFNQFHVNIHSHDIRAPGLPVVPTNAIGPVAPGLHNGAGPEIRPGHC